ncbi:MAG: tRNA(Ile)(2)-agmatinylcytidine synthase [Desulfurococcales archaeon]|nr:tRNA(Ile)(2)-agmatinylcytidine synthase [Desulfurococcales archaeon]
MVKPTDILNISFDDTDFPEGGCTTHASSLFMAKYSDKIRLLDYPLLVRLNPGIPWKTRGNASVVLRLETTLTPEKMFELANDFVEEYTAGCRHKSSSPGIVVYKGDPWIPSLRRIYEKALSDIVTKDLVEETLEGVGALYRGGRGIIGATAALSALGLGEPYTFELLTYRNPEKWGTQRTFDPQSVINADKECGEELFSNIDWTTLRPIIYPHGPDPVLYGVRGVSVDAILCFMEKLKTQEQIHGWALFRTNQGTSIHRKYAVNKARPYQIFKDDCQIIGTAEIITGSHVAIDAECTGPGKVKLLAFRESYPLNFVLRRLIPGDRVLVIGSVRPDDEVPVIAIEELLVEHLEDLVVKMSPRCPKCGHRMKSMGRGKGYRCPKCGYRSKDLKPLFLRQMRAIVGGRFIPSYSHLRHLTTPSWLKLPVLDTFPVVVKPFNPPVKHPLGSHGTH